MEDEIPTSRDQLHSANKRLKGSARSPSPELPEFDPRQMDQIALPVGMASLAATELQDGNLSHETMDHIPTVDTMLGSGDVERIAKTLQAHLGDLATGEWTWLVELQELGCSWSEMAGFLLEKRIQSPWIYFEPWVTVRKTPHVAFHVKGCVHKDLETPHDTIVRSATESSTTPVHTKSLRRTVASLCGMAGVVPNVPDKQKWNGAVEFADVSEARLGYRLDDEPLSIILARVQNAIAGLCTALAVIQETHGCCDRFSVLCRDSVRPQVELLSVHFEDIVTLHDALQIADSRDLQSLQDCAEVSRVAMRSFYMPKAASLTTEQGALHFCALTAQFLCLGLVLYSYAHCGPLDIFFLERELSKVELLGLGRRADNQIYIVARTERLTCLDAMLNSPVIVFSLSSIEGLTADRLDVLASVSDVVDTWGPATITKSSQSDQVASVDIRGGTLYALGSEKGHWASHESLNHDWWVANWDRRNKLLVEAFLQTNVACAPSEAMCLQALQGNWLPLGTGKAYWRQQERELGLQAGQHVIVTANVMWGKVPGSSLKSRLLDDLKYKREYLAFLDSPCGLRVSFCSGLAKRVRMRDLLADLMPIYVERQLLESRSDHHWKMMSDDYQVMDKLMNDSLADCASMFRNMNRSHPDCFTTFWKFAFEIILALKPTGLHADGKCFTVALIPNDPSEVMRGVSFPAERSNFWTRTLQDTQSCATFAYFTLDCLQLGGHGCRNTKEWRRKVLLLETEVRPQVSESSWLAASSAWTPEDGIYHTFGDRDAETKATLRVRVVRSPSHADPQLVVQKSSLSPSDWKRFIERWKHGEHLQEKISQTDLAHRAFITSTNNTAFNSL
ncbi:hypothetical protein CKM354_000438400 [Cercospora kikuchii]|uniref:Uncharacterized protein n=1 Tax=Cercospora kikuchii TaxID=84275 RepID=A0A9P3CMB6_9PEZI|nr:uncharacterized protein CKM354_000438400 [Cercospora kikuchii]GIZ41068.1 hypothetical protein CKM354_000438400 [Cercospora kikuchii]